MFHGGRGGANDRVHKTRIIADVHLSGHLGVLSFPFHQGLYATISPGKRIDERMLHIQRNDEFYAQATKHQRSFINSMWGTTSAHLRHMIVGVNEVLLTCIK